MRTILTVLMFLIAALSVNAKDDYKNPISMTEIGQIKIQMTKVHKFAERTVYLALDKYQNHFLVINVNYFINKGKDALNITFNNRKTTRIPFTVFFKKYYKNGEKHYIPSMWIGHTFVGGHYVDDYGAKFYCSYPLTEEQYDWLINDGIQSISVDGVYNIEYLPIIIDD